MIGSVAFMLLRLGFGYALLGYCALGRLGLLLNWRFGRGFRSCPVVFGVKKSRVIRLFCREFICVWVLLQRKRGCFLCFSSAVFCCSLSVFILSVLCLFCCVYFRKFLLVSMPAWFSRFLFAEIRLSLFVLIQAVFSAVVFSENEASCLFSVALYLFSFRLFFPCYVY